MNKNIDELYFEVYSNARNCGFTVPVIFRPYDQNRGTIDMNVWCVSVDHRRRENEMISAIGTTQHEALSELLIKLMGG